MYVRKLVTGLAASAVVVSALALTGSPAFAAVDPDDTTFTPTAADLVGVGSDTSQHAVKLIADAYNAQTPAPTAKMASYAATGGGTVPIAAVSPATGDIARPNGSGAGKALLYGAGNNTAIDFARSSSAQNATETSASLQSFPFALDTLVMAVAGSSTHAPANLTAAQIVNIYNGTTTNWDQIGGTTGVIKPYIPQAGSGTRSFFVAQLKAANGGVDVTLAGTVTEAQEHDDTLIKNNPDAVAPFSEGRAGLLGTLRVETGFRADRALYNVVRGTDVSLSAVQNAFGSSGYVCSNAARPFIEAAGFKQLATPAANGVCGSPTQVATSNFTLNSGQLIPTTTLLTVTSTVAKTAKLTAKVTASTAPQGTVSFYQGATLLQAGIPLVSGQATKTLTNVAPGSKSYTAVYTQADGSSFISSTDDGTGVVKTSSSIKETFPATVKQGKRASGVVTVTLAGISAKATGTVKITKGSKVLVTKTLVGGKVTIKLPKLTVNGKNTLKITYAGNGNATGSTKTFTIKQIKVKKK